MSKEIEIVAKSTDKVTKKVTETKGKCVQYATLAEAVKGFGEDGEKKVLAIVNMQVKIRALDALRAGTSTSITSLYKNASPEAQEKIKKLLGMA